jgi:kynureninase
VTLADAALTRAAALDAADPLAGFRDRFIARDPDLIYLDGNSLGPLPRTTADRLAKVVRDEWGDELVRAWNHWLELPGLVGDALARDILGGRPGEVIVSDSTTVNLFKLAAAALDARPGRRTILADRNDFPTDRYVLEGLAQARGLELRWLTADPVEGPQPGDVASALDDSVALLVLSHVNYRSAAVADLPAITAVVHAAGALALWDLSHAAGSVPIGLQAGGADLAVGCTYKYLDAGPGAPAFLYVRSEHQATLRNPIQGWFGQRDQFAMGHGYQPVPGVGAWLTGTPAILGLTAVEEGVRLVAEAGIEAIRAKGMALTSYAVDLLDAKLAPLGFSLGSPRDPRRRGAHIAVRHARAEELCAALLAEGVVTDYRAPDSIRLGLSPLSTSFGDAWTAIDRLARLAAGDPGETSP